MNTEKSLHIIVFLSAIISGCTSYKQVDISKDQLFFTKNPEKASLKNCNVYIHDENYSIKLANPAFQNESIIGQTGSVLSSNESAKIKKPSGRKEKMIHKRDVHIYIKNSPALHSASNDLSKTSDIPDIIIRKDDIKNIRAYATDKKNTLGLILLFIVLGFLATVMFLALLVFSVNQSSNAYNNSSGGGSGSE